MIFIQAVWYLARRRSFPRPQGPKPSKSSVRNVIRRRKQSSEASLLLFQRHEMHVCQDLLITRQHGLIILTADGTT